MVGLVGILLAYVYYMAAPKVPELLADDVPADLFVPAEQMVFRRAVRRGAGAPDHARSPGSLWQVGDATIIDGVPNGLAALTAGGSAQVVKLQTGSIAVYAFAMLIGVVVLSLLVLLLLIVR